MHKHLLKLRQIYKISFFSFYIIPIITILIKLIYGAFSDAIMEIWFLSLLLVITVVISLLPKLNKLSKERIIYLSVSVIIFFFGLGAVGFETTYMIVDFFEYETLIKVPYIIMFSILVMQLVAILIMSYYNKSKTTLNDVTIIITMNKPLYTMMGIMVVLAYSISIVVKTILDVDLKYIGFELSILLGYFLFYVGLAMLMKFQFTQNIKNSLVNSLFFIPVLSIGFAVGIIFFNENFVFQKADYTCNWCCKFIALFDEFICFKEELKVNHKNARLQFLVKGTSINTLVPF